MIRHIVSWKLQTQAMGATKAENLVRMRMALEALPGKVEAIRHLKVGIDGLRSDSSWDIVLIVDFETWDDLRTYQQHPEHLKVAELVAGLRQERAVVDFEL